MICAIIYITGIAQIIVLMNFCVTISQVMRNNGVQWIIILCNEK